MFPRQAKAKAGATATRPLGPIHEAHRDDTAVVLASIASTSGSRASSLDEASVQRRR